MDSPDFPLILLRHGLSEIPLDRCIGQYDAPLSPQGRAEVADLAAHWPHEAPQRIFSSDLGRCAETAQIIAAAMNLPLCTDARLREISFGSWENTLWDDIYQADPALMTKWGEDWLNTAPPGGETVRELQQRVIACFTSICQAPPLPTLIVAHAGSLRALSCHLSCQPIKQLFDYQFKHAQPLKLI